MPDLRVDYLGLTLRSPFVASSGPLTGDIDRIAQLEQAGAAALVLPSLFEEQIEHDTAEIDRLLSINSDSFHEADSFLPVLDDDTTGIDAYLELVEAAKERVGIPVIASLNGTNLGGWVRYARLLVDAGADAIELNLYTVAADPAVSGATIESEHLELVHVVTEDAQVPISVKISPYYSSLAAFVLGLQESGAAGVTMFNRFYSPDLDLETLDVMPRISLSSPEEVRLPLRWIGIVREYLTMSIAASSGVHSGFDAAKLILAGADVTMATSSLLRNGIEHLATLEAQLIDWMSEHDYDAVSEMRGAVASHAAADPTAYERANYIGNLATYTSHFLGSKPLALRSS